MEGGLWLWSAVLPGARYAGSGSPTGRPGGGGGGASALDLLRAETKLAEAQLAVLSIKHQLMLSGNINQDNTATASAPLPHHL